MAEASCLLLNTVGVSATLWAYWHDFLHVDSSHSGLITTNSRGLAGAWSIQEGVILKKRRSGSSRPSNGPCSVRLQSSVDDIGHDL